MKKDFLYIAVLVAGIITIAMSCSKGSGDREGGASSPPSSCASMPARFSADVNPIIQSSCAASSGCHGSGSFNGPGALKTFDQIKSAASSIKSAVVSKQMPLGGSLTSAQIQTISCWVDNGALNN
jgi:uncharacterized membrane protein